MKKYLFIVLLSTASFIAGAQVDSLTPPYLKFPELPPLKILLTDSTTFYGKAQFPKDTAMVFILFNPDCSHCQHETEEMIAHKEDFNDKQVVMITSPRVNFSDIKSFVEKYRVNELKNVAVGKDLFYFMPSFYRFGSFPFLALYDKKGKLITTLEGSHGMERIVELLKQ